MVKDCIDPYFINSDFTTDPKVNHLRVYYNALKPYVD
jgi:hypothetical protein